jgi:DNA-binding CsgD family transcriptional regulator/PAS domain-containing protein
MDDFRASDIAAFSAATDGLYAAATGALGWSEALGRIAAILNSPAGTLNVHNPVKRISRTIVGEFGTDPSYSESFNKTYGSLSSFSLVMMLFSEGTVGRVFEYEGFDKVKESRFYKEWCAPQRYHDFLGALLIREPEAIYGIGFVRLIDQPPFDAQDERMLTLLVPHITRAFRISGALETLQTQRQDLLAAIDSLPTPIVAIDESGAIVNINRSAIALGGSDGLLRTQYGLLVLADPAAQAALSAAIRSGLADPLTIPLGGPSDPTAALIPYTGSSRRIAALLTIHPAHRAETPPGVMLQQAFGFTPAELRVLVLLLEGGDRATISRDLGLSLATVKTHIQGLFAKTQTNRQADLVRVVMGGG